MVTPDARRVSTRYIQAKYGFSERRACQTAGVHRSMVRYRSRRSDDGDLRRLLNELALRFPRYGYRQLGDRIRRQGDHHNWKKIYRVYREEELQVRRRKKKRARGGRYPIEPPISLDTELALEFWGPRNRRSNGKGTREQPWRGPAA